MSVFQVKDREGRPRAAGLGEVSSSELCPPTSVIYGVVRELICDFLLFHLAFAGRAPGSTFPGQGHMSASPGRPESEGAGGG